MASFYVFPNHLFESTRHFSSKNQEIYLIEDPSYFRPTTNKVRLVFMRASMKYYESYLKSRGFHNVHYVNVQDVPTFYERRHGSGSGFECFHPEDYDLLEHIVPNRVHENPSFLAGDSLLQKYHDQYAKEGKGIRHVGFFGFMKKELGILVGVPSQDKKNREVLNEEELHAIPKAQLFRSKWVKSAIEWIRSFPEGTWTGVGNPENARLYPVTHAQARIQLKRFLRDKFAKFGPYEDAITSASPFIYHANISCVLNNGLLLPSKVLHEVMKRSEVPLESREGFVRQVLGWREYMHYIYRFHYHELKKANEWGNLKRLDWDAWTRGETGIQVLDEEIRACAQIGYAHHIIRLMVFLNLLVLYRIHPHDCVKWFMDVCSIDAYPWVMWSNIIAMGGFSRRFMSKTYLATENYYRQMSYPKKKGPLDPIWRRIYDRFPYNKNLHRI